MTVRMTENDNVDLVKSVNTEKEERRIFVEEDSSIDDHDLTLEDLAPDGGWGWLVALAMIIVFVTTFSASSSFAVIYGDFFAATGQAGIVMTLLNSVFMISFSLAGLFTNVLLKRYSMRQVGVVGSVLFATASIIMAFVTHVYQLAVITLIQGVGGGFVNNICNANFTAYFVVKRAKVMSIAQVIVGIGSIVYPILIGRMMEIYGFRGTQVLVGAMSLNGIVGMLLMHPVQWHLRDPKEVLAERRKLRNTEMANRELFLGNDSNHMDFKERRNTLGELKMHTDRVRWSSLGNLMESANRRHSSLLIETLKENAGRSHSDLESGGRPRSKSSSGRPKVALQQTLSNPSAASIGSIAGALAEVQSRSEYIPKYSTVDSKSTHPEEKEDLIAKNNNHIKKDKNEYSTLKMLADLFELSILKDRTFVIMSVGISFVFVSDFTFMSLLPLAMLEEGYTTSETSLTITIGASAELVARILLAVFTLFIDTRAKTIFFFATIAMGIAKLGFYYLESTLTGIMISTFLLGAVRSWLYVPQPLVVVEHYPVEKHAACYGIFSLVSGFIIIVFGPVLGFVKDLTNSFRICQLLLVTTNCILVIPWGIELLGNYRKNKKTSSLK